MKSKPLFLHDDLDKYFFNRNNELNSLNYQISSVKYDLPQQILLTGYRGVGKSYLLKKIMKELDDDIICSYIDISQLYSLQDQELTIEDVLIELLKNMNENIKYNKYINKYSQIISKLINNLKIRKYNFSDAIDILDIPIPSAETDYRKLSQFVMEFPQKIVDKIDEIKGFIIIIDEFQMLRKINHLDKFFWLIRSFNQNQHNVSYIFTGSISRTSNLIEEINGESGAFGGRMIQIEIKPFSKEQTKSYFETSMPEIKFTDDGFDRFYQCTRGIPLYINSFYNVMDSSEEYNSQLVKETFYNNMNQILFMWMRVWSSLSKKEKNIVKIIMENDPLTWSELLKICNISQATLNKYLTNLKDKGILDYYDKKYTIQDKMLETWLKHEKKVFGIYPL